MYYGQKMTPQYLHFQLYHFWNLTTFTPVIHTRSQRNCSRRIIIRCTIQCKCQTEQLADTDQVGGDFHRQLPTFDNPVHETAAEESSYGVLSIVSNLISNAKTTSDALWVENDSSVPLLLVVPFSKLNNFHTSDTQSTKLQQKNHHTMYYPSH